MISLQQQQNSGHEAEDPDGAEPSAASFLGPAQELELFGHRAVLISHRATALAVFSGNARTAPSKSVLYLFALHMFLQFHREFTKDVLDDFVEEDREFKAREVSSVRINADKSHSQSFVQSERREYLLSLFQLYEQVPLTEITTNFALAFNEIFYEERPQAHVKYFLSNLIIVKQNQVTKQPEELFSFCFAENTSKEAEFVASGHTRLMMARMMRHISRTNPLPFRNREYAGTALRQDFPADMSIKLQMYEFFFSNILLKGMVLPFF